MFNHYQIAKEELGFYGEDHTSLQNLLAIIIGPKATPNVTGNLASLGLNELKSMSIEELKRIEGVGEVIATRIATAFHLAQRINYFRKEDKIVIKSPEDVADCFQYLNDYDQEHFDVAFLNTKNVVIARKNIFVGSLNASVVHPREIFREALKQGAASIICAHQHPSGDPTPSQEDIHVTRRLHEVGKVTGIELLDHVVIGKPNFVSLKEKGYL